MKTSALAYVHSDRRNRDISPDLWRFLAQPARRRTRPRKRRQSRWIHSFRGVAWQTSGAGSPSVRTSFYVLLFLSRPMENKSQPPHPISLEVHNCTAQCN